MKYKLIKSLPGIPEGIEFRYFKENGYGTVMCIDGPYADIINSFINIFGTDNDFIEEIPKKPKSVFDLKVGDSYWVIVYADLPQERSYDGNIFDVGYIDHGNAFLTKEEAEKELSRRKAIVKIKKYCHEKGWDMEWKEGGDNYIFYYSYRLPGVSHSLSDGGDVTRTESSIGYPKDEKQALEIIEHFTPELKLILGVE